MKQLILVVLAVFALALAEAVYYLVRYFSEQPTEELRRRLRNVGEPAMGFQIVRRRRLARRPGLERMFGALPGVARLERLIEESELDLTVAQLLGYTLALAGIGAGLGITAHRPVLAVAAALGLGAIPAILLLRSRRLRTQRISEQLPDALEMMARAISAGHTLPSAFKLLAHESPAPIAVEFARAYEQQNLGMSFERSVQSMTERVPHSMDLKLFAVSVVIHRETGGNLVEILEGIAQTMRERFRFYSRLRVLTAEGKVSGVILGALPFVVALLTALFNPGYLAELGEGLGRVILAAGILLWCVGVLAIRVLLKVEY